MTDETPDWSRVDSFMAARRRAMILHASWRPLLAGAAGAGAMILCAFAGAYLAGPTLKSKIVEIPVLDVMHQPIIVPEVTMKPLTVPDITVTTHPIDIPIPRVVEAARPISRETPPTSPALAPRNPTERHFEAGRVWKGAIIRGRILREAPPNGFVLATDAGEAPFYPARAGSDGAPPEVDPTKRDDITGLEGRLALCRETPSKTYLCVSLSPSGAEELIPQRPMPVGEPL
jgi:hypothetical protein